jgi:predicted DNA-binding mobile mystery protein A
MNLKATVQRQYRGIVEDAAASLAVLKIPSEGWLRTARKALGISGAELARKMGVTRARVAQAEHAELTGGVTLRSMQATAEAMGCRFVYAIIPPGRIEDIIMAQARKKALAIVGTASQHMALENQALPNDRISQEVERLTREIAQEMPSDFWREN